MKRSETDWRDLTICFVCKKPMDPASQFRVWASLEGFPQGVCRVLCSAVCSDRYMEGDSDE